MPIRVLLADPDEGLLSLYQEGLAQEGFEVATARDGVDCVAKLRGFLPDVLVLEPELPWGQGEGVLAVMNEEASLPRVPVILFTHPLAWANQPCLAAYPCSDWVVKPVKPELLADRIRRVLEVSSPPGGFFG